MVSCYVTLPHIFDHLRPIWDALDPSVRGRLYIGFDPSMQRAAQDYEAFLGLPPPSDVPVLVGSGNDLPAVQRAILASHGVDQTYKSVDHICWAGGPGRENVILFLCPHERSAAKNRARYPHTPAVVVGSPHVEALRKLPPYPLSEQRIAISAHWEASHLAPELRSGFAWFEDAYEKAVREDPEGFVLHGHPRYQDYTAWKAREWGCEFVADFADVTQRAWLYIADNSSTLYEWAALGRPVVVVSPPWYDTGIEHGIRFTEFRDVGPHLIVPTELGLAIQIGIADPAPIAQRRQQIVRELFGEDLSDGAAARAARAIEAVL